MTSKKKLFDNSALQQDIAWGNIPVPGISDQDLHSKNWNHITAVQSFWDSPRGQKQRKRYSVLSREHNRERSLDPRWVKKRARISRKIAQDPERNRNLSRSAKKAWGSLEGRKKRGEISRANWQRHRATMSKALKDRYRDGKLSKKISQALKNSDRLKAVARLRCNTIKTPAGIFESRKKAAEHYKIDPTSINGLMKKYPKDYYYIKIGNGATGYKKRNKF